MTALYHASVTIHVLAAMLWLGGMFFLAVVGAPVLRAIEPPALRQQLFQQLGLRFRSVGWHAIVVLVVTGVGNLYFRGLLVWDGVLSSAKFWSSSFGHALGGKIAAVVLMIAVSALHDFYFGPMTGRAEAGSPRALALRKRAMWLARINAIIGVVLVAIAVRLARGGF